MSFTAGYKGIAQVTTTNIAAVSPGDDIIGVENLNFPDGNEILDVTSINNTNGEPAAIPGIRNRGPYSLSCNLDTSDAGQGRLFTAKNSRAKVWLTLLADGVNGYRIAVYVTKADRKAEAKGKAMVDFEMVFAGDAPTAIP